MSQMPQTHPAPRRGGAAIALIAANSSRAATGSAVKAVFTVFNRRCATRRTLSSCANEIIADSRRPLNGSKRSKTARKRSCLTLCAHVLASVGCPASPRHLPASSAAPHCRRWRSSSDGPRRREPRPRGHVAPRTTSLGAAPAGRRSAVPRIGGASISTGGPRRSGQMRSSSISTALRLRPSPPRARRRSTPGPPRREEVEGGRALAHAWPAGHRDCPCRTAVGWRNRRAGPTCCAPGASETPGA
jgi:hypothetical protein